MPLWHDAWPNKDVKAMAAMLPDIEKHFAAVNKAELPLVLRDKQAAWVAGVDDLKQTVGAYKAAVAAGDNDALLKAAEKLHAQYEALVKIVRPILKEMEDFHASLYVLYHYQMSPFQLEKASESIRALQVKMDALNTAALPDRLKAKTEAFNDAAREAGQVDRRARRAARRQGRVEDQGGDRAHAHAVREPGESVLASADGDTFHFHSRSGKWKVSLSAARRLVPRRQFLPHPAALVPDAPPRPASVHRRAALRHAVDSQALACHGVDVPRASRCPSSHASAHGGTRHRSCSQACRRAHGWPAPGGYVKRYAERPGTRREDPGLRRHQAGPVRCPRPDDAAGRAARCRAVPRRRRVVPPVVRSRQACRPSA